MQITAKNSSLLVMDEAGVSDALAERHILASGGAADCLIVAARSSSHTWTYLAHVTRSTPMQQLERHIRLLPAPVEIYLSSSSFKNDPTNAIALEVKKIFKFAGSYDYKITTEYSSGALAINAKDGDVVPTFEHKLCSFANQDISANTGEKKKKADRKLYQVVAIPPRKKTDTIIVLPKEEEEQKQRLKQQKEKQMKEIMTTGLTLYVYSDSLGGAMTKFYRA
jgi:hypothetical protein